MFADKYPVTNYRGLVVFTLVDTTAGFKNFKSLVLLREKRFKNP